MLTLGEYNVALEGRPDKPSGEGVREPRRGAPGRPGTGPGSQQVPQTGSGGVVPNLRNV